MSLALAMPLAVTAGPAVAGPEARTGSVPALQQTVLATAPLADAAAARPGGLAVAPSTPVVKDYALSGLARSVASQAKSTGSTPLRARSAPRRVSGFGVVGVTWQGASPEGLRLSVRTRVGDQRWSAWQELHAEQVACPTCAGGAVSEHGPGPENADLEQARSGTDPVAVGEVDEVQLRVTAPGGALPRDLTLSVIDPGETVTATSPASAERTVRTSRAGAEPRTALTAVAGTLSAPRPKIFSRAEWGADERMRSGSPSYGTIKAGFVHHTVNANGYTRDQVPSIIRGIYAYHTQSRGWSDIGYNFLVDRFGRIWEGRYGGVARPVIGAHTYGYNHLSFAMSAIGNYETAEPTNAMLNAYGALFAWKLSLHGIGAKSMQTLGSTRLPAINGHRDVGQTACPGAKLYARLGGIRNRAANAQTSEPVLSDPPAVEPRVYERGPHVVRDFTSDGRPDLVGLDLASGRLHVQPADVGPGLNAPVKANFRGDIHDLVAGVGDVTGDGRPDVLTRRTRSGVTKLRPGRADGLFRRPLDGADTSQFRHGDLLAGAGDLVGNDRPDVVMRGTRSQTLWAFPGRAHGRWGVRRVLIKDASRFTSIAAAGDLDGDGQDDLLATVANRLVLLPGRSEGGLGRPRVLSRTWAQYDLTSAGVDVTGDGRPDLLARERRSGRTWIFDLGDDGRPGPRLGGWRVWSDLRELTVVGAGPDGSGRLVGRAADDRMVVLTGAGTGWFGTPIRSERPLPKANFLQAAGDWTGDGFVDVIARAADTGNVFLYPGDGAGLLGQRKRLRAGWTDRTTMVVTPDVTGDELPDLIARNADGALYVYSSDGEGRMLKGVLARPQLFKVDLLAQVGYWNSDDVRDLVVRRASSKELYLLPGTTSGTFGAPVPLSVSFEGYDEIAGIGDRDGDGQPDLVARETATGRLWFFRGTPTGLKARRFLAPDARRFKLLG